MAERFVRITHTKPQSKLNAHEKAVRERLEMAIHEAIDRFHNETPKADGLLEIELYPCDENCKDCKDAEAA